MKKFDFPLVADVLFYGASAFFLSLGFLRYARLPLALAVTLALLFGLGAALAAFLFISRRHRKRYLSKKERERREALLLHLALEREERVRALLLTALCADEKEAHCEGDELSLDGERLVPRFTMQPVSADEVAALLRAHGEAPFTLVCNALSPEAEKLLASFGRKALRGDDVFELFERTQTAPEKLICGEIPRRTAKQKWRSGFSKKNARPFFASALLLLVMSLFTFFPVYYLISGSLLLACAIAVRIFGYA